MYQFGGADRKSPRKPRAKKELTAPKRLSKKAKALLEQAMKAHPTNHVSQVYVEDHSKDEQVVISSLPVPESIKTESTSVNFVVTGGSQNERTVLADGNELRIVSTAPLEYTVVPEGQPLSSPEAVQVKIDPNTNTMITQNNVTQIINIHPTNNNVQVVTKESWWSKTKNRAKNFTIVALLACLLMTTGQPAAKMECHRDTSPTPVAPVPEPLHFILPQTNTLGVHGPLTLANMLVLEKVDTLVTNKAAEMTRNAYDFGMKTAMYKHHLQYDKMNDVIQKIHQNIRDLKKENEQMVKDSIRNQVELDQKQEQWSRELTSQKEASDKEIRHLGKLIEDTREALDQSEQSNFELKQQASQTLQALDEVQRQLIEMSSSSTGDTTLIASLRQDVKTIENSKADLLERFNQAETSHQKAVNNLKSNLKDAKRSQAVSHQKIKDLQEKLDQAKTQHDMNIEYIKLKYQSNANTSTSELSKLKKQYDDAVKKFEKNTKALNDKIEEAKVKAEKSDQLFVAKIEQLQSLTQARQKEIDDLKMIKRDLEKQVSHLTQTTEAAQNTIRSYAQQRVFAHKNMEKFNDWTAPHISVSRSPDGKYKVKYDGQHLKQVSPFLSDHIESLAQQTEAMLNDEKTGTVPKKNFDITITQTIHYRKSNWNKLTEWIRVSKPNETTGGRKYHMVLVGTSDLGKNNDAPVQELQYVVLDVENISFYQDLVKHSAMVSQTIVKTVTSEPKTVTKTETATSTYYPEFPPTPTADAFNSFSSTAAPEPTITPFSYPATKAAIESVTSAAFEYSAAPSPLSEPSVVESASAASPSAITTASERVASLIDSSVEKGPAPVASLMTETLVGKNTIDSSDDVQVITEEKEVKGTGAIVKTRDDICYITEMMITTFVPLDPKKPTHTVLTPVVPNKADVLSVIDHPPSAETKETEVKVYQDTSDNESSSATRVKTDERISCSGGKYGVVLRETMFCVDDFIDKLDLARKIRLNEVGKEHLTKLGNDETLVRYAEGRIGATTPFGDERMYENVGLSKKDAEDMKDYFNVRYFASKDHTIDKYLKEHPHIDKTVFFKLMETKEASKTRSGWKLKLSPEEMELRKKYQVNKSFLDYVGDFLNEVPTVLPSINNPHGRRNEVDPRKRVNYPSQNQVPENPTMYDTDSNSGSRKWNYKLY